MKIPHFYPLWGAYWYGVAFLVATWFRKAVFSFKPVSERVCILKIRTPGGKLCHQRVCSSRRAVLGDFRRFYDILLDFR